MKSLAFAASRISIPFIASIGIAYVMRETISQGVGYAPFSWSVFSAIPRGVISEFS